MSDRMNVEERLEAMATRLERVERLNRLMKVWGSIAIAVLIAAGPFASNVMAKAKPKAVNASAFNLESDGKVVASLGIFNGQPSLVFLDNGGKLVMGVGINGALTLPTGHAVGVGIYDGNADIPGGTGVIRTSFGVTPSGTSASEGIATFDSTAATRSFVGSPPDGSYSGAFFYDTAGNLRTGIEYDPATNVNFNGFFDQDGSGHNLSLIGSAIAANAGLGEEANQSFMELLDTSLPRVIEFQNSTNQGGINFNPGSTTVNDSW